MLVTQEPLIQTLGCVNWPDEFPDRPEVVFDMRCDGDEILLHFRVREDVTRAVCAADREPVWEDSCVEFFFAPAGDGLYYNFECSCTGKLWLCCGRGRDGDIHGGKTNPGSPGGTGEGGRRKGERGWQKIETAFRWKGQAAACAAAGRQAHAPRRRQRRRPGSFWPDGGLPGRCRRLRSACQAAAC